MLAAHLPPSSSVPVCPSHQLPFPGPGPHQPLPCTTGASIQCLSGHYSTSATNHLGRCGETFSQEQPSTKLLQPHLHVPSLPRGQAAAGSQATISPCSYVSMSASPGEAPKAPASSLPAAPALPGTFPGRREQDGEGRDPMLRLPKALMPANAVTGRAVLRSIWAGITPHAPGQHLSKPSLGTDAAPRGHIQALAEQPLPWCHSRRLRAGRLGALCHGLKGGTNAVLRAQQQLLWSFLF